MFPIVATTNTDPPRVRESEQLGWNQGYLAGEQERIALAVHNSDLEADLLTARRELDRLRAIVAKHCPGEL